MEVTSRENGTARLCKTSETLNLRGNWLCHKDFRPLEILALGLPCLSTQPETLSFMKHIAIMIAVPDPAPNYETVEELVEQIQVRLPRGVTIDHVVELTEALHSVLTRTKSENLVRSLAGSARRNVAEVRAIR